MIRVYHTWDKWECYPAGFYENKPLNKDLSKEECENSYAEFLRDIPAFEAACGCDYVSNWLASRGGKLVIKMPSGRNLKANDINALQTALHNTVGALMAFYEGTQKLDETLDAINQGLESLAWHKGNVEQHSQPQLELDDDEN